MMTRKKAKQSPPEQQKYNLGELIKEFLSSIKYRGQEYAFVSDAQTLTLLVSLDGVEHGSVLEVANEADLKSAESQIAEALDALRAEICSGMDSINRGLSEAVDRLMRIHDSEPRIEFEGLPTGFVDLDNHLLGLEAGELMIVAGRPGMGKTSLSLNIAEYVAHEKYYEVALFSTESSREDIAIRMLAASGRLNNRLMRSGYMSDDEWSKLSYALGKVHDLPMHISSKVGLTIDSVCERARELAKVATRPLKLIVVDRIQGLATAIDASSRSIELEVIASRLKALGMELGCAVIATSSLNRSLESRIDKRPLLQDLRDSGGLEDEADVVLFLYRADYYKPDSPDKGLAEVIVAKNRRGGPTTIELAYLAEYCRFENLAKGIY